jgi:hypothetical protein
MYRHEHNVCRNTDVKGHSGEVFEMSRLLETGGKSSLLKSSRELG